MDSLSWIIEHSYVFIFIAMVIEGPVITMLAAFAAHLGYFNIFIILGLSILGDFVGDVIYYLIGRLGRYTLINKYGKYVGLTPERIINAEKHIHTHKIKTILAMKLTPLFAGPGLMIVGASRVKIGMYIAICLAMIVPNSLIFTSIGYLFGNAYTRLFRYYNTAALVIGLVLIAITFILAYRRATNTLSRTIEDLDQ